MIYATINKDGIVTGVSQLSGRVEKADMIEIDKYDESLMGKKYDKGAFVSSGVTKPPYVDPLETINKKLDEILARLK